MLATFCFMSSNMLANPIVAGYAESLGADGMLMGAVAGSMSFISLFCRPIAGNLSDKTSKRTLVAVGTVLYFAAGLLYYFANSPIMLIMARVINGVGFACCSVCLATWMSLLLPIRHMGAGMGLYGTMNALAMTDDTRHWKQQMDCHAAHVLLAQQAQTSHWLISPKNSIREWNNRRFP